jgi:hypothetical protein
MSPSHLILEAERREQLLARRRAVVRVRPVAFGHPVELVRQAAAVPEQHPVVARVRPQPAVDSASEAAVAVARVAAALAQMRSTQSN